MSKKKTWVGSVGPHLYDTAKTYEDGVAIVGLRAEGGVYVDDAPDTTLDPTGAAEGLHYLPRIADLNTRFFSVIVADIDDPSGELSAYGGDIVGSFIVAHEVQSNHDYFTIYAWDSICGSPLGTPWVIAGSSGFWVAIGGKYNAMDMLGYGDYTITPPSQLITENIKAYDATGVVLKDNGGSAQGTFNANGLTLATGASVNELSTDTTLGGNSDDAVPTEKAIKSYVDGVVSGAVHTRGHTLGNVLDHTDVLVTSVGDGEVLRYNVGTTKWINNTLAEAGIAASGHSHGDLHTRGHALSSSADQTDVLISGVGNGEVLRYNSGTSKWINNTLAEAGIAAASHAHTHVSTTGRTANDHHTESHEARHRNGGADEVVVTDLSGVLADAQTAIAHALASGSEHSHPGDSYKGDALICNIGTGYAIWDKVTKDYTTGWSGDFTTDEGGTATVENGLITGMA